MLWVVQPEDLYTGCSERGSVDDVTEYYGVTSTNNPVPYFSVYDIPPCTTQRYDIIQSCTHHNQGCDKNVYFSSLGVCQPAPVCLLPDS